MTSGVVRNLEHVEGAAKRQVRKERKQRRRAKLLEHGLARAVEGKSEHIAEESVHPLCISIVHAETANGKAVGAADNASSTVAEEVSTEDDSSECDPTRCGAKLTAGQHGGARRHGSAPTTARGRGNVDGFGEGQGKSGPNPACSDLEPAESYMYLHDRVQAAVGKRKYPSKDGDGSEAGTSLNLAAAQKLGAQLGVYLPDEVMLDLMAAVEAEKSRITLNSGGVSMPRPYRV